jgi:hypothetical protein
MRVESSVVTCAHGARMFVGWDSVPTGSGRRPNLLGCGRAALGNSRVYFLGMVCFLAMAMSWDSGTAAADDADRIQPYPGNPTYWQYRGEPILLIGGADQDNPFNHPHLPPEGLASHLDLLVSQGGNYIRNTMTSRDLVDEDLEFFRSRNHYPFHRDPETGLFDMERFEQEYWQRFRAFLEMTAARGILVQIEIWDRVDFGRDHVAYPARGWSAQPYNPKNNVNYTVEESKLPEVVDTHPGAGKNNFFRTTPEQEDNPLVLRYQKKFVDKLLSVAFAYDHVLYCISNETSESELWSGYWARYIREKAEEANVGVEVTEMWGSTDLSSRWYDFTFDDPELYSFVEVSQGNHRDGQEHWDNLMLGRQRMAASGAPRPMTSVKIYGGSRHGGGTAEGKDKFWRSIIGGLAAARFHRPGPRRGFYGIGLIDDRAQTQLRSMSMFLDAFNVFAAEPDNGLLSDRAENEAYCAADPGKQYAVYFPDGGSVTLDLSVAKGAYRVRWLDIKRSRWSEEATLPGGKPARLTAPGEGQWVVLIEPAG